MAVPQGAISGGSLRAHACQAVSADPIFCHAFPPRRDHARSIPGKSQLFINACARALEVRTLHMMRRMGVWGQLLLGGSKQAAEVVWEELPTSSGRLGFGILLLPLVPCMLTQCCARCAAGHPPPAGRQLWV